MVASHNSILLDSHSFHVSERYRRCRWSLLHKKKESSIEKRVKGTLQTRELWCLTSRLTGVPNMGPDCWWHDITVSFQKFLRFFAKQIDDVNTCFPQTRLGVNSSFEFERTILEENNPFLIAWAPGGPSSVKVKDIQTTYKEQTLESIRLVLFVKKSFNSASRDHYFNKRIIIRTRVEYSCTLHSIPKF